MIFLSPTTDEQEFNIVPRDPDEYQNISLTITEEATGISESFDDVSVFENGDYICVSVAFSILKEDKLYRISMTQDGSNWFRGKARCTSQSGSNLKYDNNTKSNDEFESLQVDEGFVLLG